MSWFEKGVAKRNHTPGEVRYNPEWRRESQPPTRRPHPTLTPKPVTRQVERATARRAEKQPLGMSSEAWHKAQGFGKVKPFGSHRTASSLHLGRK